MVGRRPAGASRAVRRWLGRLPGLRCAHRHRPALGRAAPLVRGPQDRHDHLLRPQGQHRPDGEDRRRGDQRGQGALLHLDGGGDHPPWREDREVHRRRDHGGVRAPAGPRGRRAARGPCGLRHDARHERAEQGPARVLRRRDRRPHRRQHRRGRREQRPECGAAAGHRRRGQRGRPARAGRAGERGPHRRGHLRPRALVRRGRRGRAARAQGQGRARARVPPAPRPRRRRCHRDAGVGRGRRARRPRRPARAAPGGPARGREPGRRADHRGPGRGRRRQVVPRGHVPERGAIRDHRAPWPLPPVRRRHHVLAAPRGRALRRRHRGRRHAPGGARQDRGHARRGARRGGDPGPPRLDRRAHEVAVPGPRDLLGRPQVPRGALGATARRPVHRGRPQRGGDVPRSPGAPARHHGAPVGRARDRHRSPGPRREAPGLGGATGCHDGRDAGPARRGHRAPGGGPPRRPRR